MTSLCASVPLWFVVLSGHGVAYAQSLDQRLDNERYLRGLRELQLPEVIDEYLRLHPPADDVEAALQAIARQQASLANAAAGDARAAAVVALLQARADLIAKHPADARRAVWLTDQASDIFFEALSADALGLTAIFGLPDAAQRERAAILIAQMNEAAANAEHAIDSAIRALEGQPNFAKDVMLQQRRRQLADVERDRRIPFLRGIASYLNAAFNLNDPAEKQAAWELTTRTLSPLADSLDGQPLMQARLYDGLAQARLGRYDPAEQRFASVAKDPIAEPADVFAARMGGVLNRFVRSGPQSALEGLASVEEKYRDPSMLFFRVLIADQEFRLRRAQAESAPAADRGKLMAAAFSSYMNLLKLPYPSGTISRDTLRAIVFARLTTAAASSDASLLAGVQLPSIVAIAQADAQTREPASREQAIITLEDTLRSSTLAPEDRAAALFSLGRALYEAQQPLLAAQRFMELARDIPTDSQADKAIELAATLAFDEYRAAPNDDNVRRTLRETLDVLLAKYANLPSIDRWQYAAGRLALVEDRFDDAVQRFAKVTPNAAEWLDANFMQAATSRARAISAGAGAAAQAMHQQTRDAVAKAQPIIERALAEAKDADRRTSLQYYLAMLRVFAAEATLAMGDPQKAIDALAGIENEQGIGSDAVGEAMRVRINAYQSLRPPKPDEALKDLQRFVQASPKQAGAALQPMVASLSADVQRLIDADRAEEAKSLATRTLLPAAKTLESWLTTADAPTDAAQRSVLELRVAEAYRLAGEYEPANVIFVRLLRLQPDSSEILLGQAECLYALGGDQHLADAMGIYKRLAASGEAGGHDTFWLSQLRMLQILDATNRGTQQILPRIERLRQTDAEFGGERFRRGFDALRSKYAAKSG